ncbi:uncharacterized protein LOC119733978 [Patiria miniata]|uniref:Uncharacterized protein n=1 Tax=Patiria miniata TaxID=46514 RepID=A0A914AIC2_PATMI|nr:uncharacterized protein LOC119733978 [Patiria miniata]
MIYVKLVTHSETTSEGRKKKCTRKYDAYHHCLFCPPGKNVFCNFSKHLAIQKHQHEPEVREIKRLEPTDTDSKEDAELKLKERKRKIALLRFRGDHEHNIDVLKKKRGEVVLGRRFNSGQFDVTHYGPCPICFEWLQLKLISRHECPGACDGPTHSQRALITRSLVISGRITEEASMPLVKEVFSIMLFDEVGKTARADALIVCLGNQALARNVGNKLMRGNYTSSVMRLASNLLLHLRKDPVQKIAPPSPGSPGCSNKNDMWDYIRPQHFDRCVKAALATAFQDGDDLNELDAPSNAIKIGYDLKRMCNLKMGIAIRARNAGTREECRDFMDLMQSEWSTRVTKLARVRLAERQYNLKQQLPKPDDLVQMNNFLTKELSNFDLSLSTLDNYRTAVQLVEAKLISYNRRRCGEVQAMRLCSYEQRKCGVSDLDEQLTRDLTDFEKHLLESQEVIVIRGKTGRGVPVLVPAECSAVLKFLTDAEVRRDVGIHPENKYVFAASRGFGVVRGYECLSKVCQRASLSHPGRITSVTLRKYMATISQVVNLSRSELDWVCDHLGHTVDVHRTHYRARSDVIERIEVAKLLLIQDKGIVNQFVGKTLQDIQFSDIVFPPESPDQHHNPPQASPPQASPLQASPLQDGLLEGLMRMKQMTASVRSLIWMKS